MAPWPIPSDVVDFHISAPERRIPLVFKGRSLVSEHKKERRLAISLLLVGVSLSQDVHSQTPMIKIAASMEERVWLVFVDGDESAGKLVMDMMGKLGAIRYDFNKLFSIAHKPLGNGSSGAVFNVGRQIPTEASGKDAVAKMCFVKDADVLGAELCKEMDMLTAVQGHPNVIELHGLFHRDESSAALDDATVQQVEGRPRLDTSWVLLLRGCPGGDLFDKVLAGNPSEIRAKEIVMNLLSAFVHIHGIGIIHRDVKPENVLFTTTGQAVLADFGFACHIQDKQAMMARGGTPGYTAPEVLGVKSYGTEIDCFSLGSLLFFVLTSQTPFHGPNVASILRRTRRCAFNFGASEWLKIPSSQCNRFIVSLLTKCPEDRLSAEEALLHPWLHDGSEEAAPAAPPRSRPRAAAPSHSPPAAPSSAPAQQAPSSPAPARQAAPLDDAIPRQPVPPGPSSAWAVRRRLFGRSRKGSGEAASSLGPAGPGEEGPQAAASCKGSGEAASSSGPAGSGEDGPQAAAGANEQGRPSVESATLTPTRPSGNRRDLSTRFRAMFHTGKGTGPSKAEQ